MTSHTAVFLDRDGTITRDVPYCSRPEDVEILPTVVQSIKALNDSGMKVVVITNQSGVARQYFTEEMLLQIHDRLKDELGKGGAHLDAIYYCPHHPDDNCGCRKPNAGLFLDAAADLAIDLRRSYVVGDMQLDIDAGKAIGSKTLLVREDSQLHINSGSTPDYCAENLLEAVNWILHDRNDKK